MELTDALNEKVNLEIEKLKEEVTELRKPWYKQLPVYFQLFTFTVTCLTILYSFASGWLDAKLGKLELEKERLQYEITKFEDKRDSLSIQNKRLAQELDSIRKDLNQLAPQLRVSIARLKEVKKEYNKVEAQNNNFKKEIAEIEYMIYEGKIKEASERLQKLVKSYGKLYSAFSDDFSDEFR